jgi:hypothetical protein
VTGAPVTVFPAVDPLRLSFRSDKVALEFFDLLNQESQMMICVDGYPVTQAAFDVA